MKAGQFRRVDDLDRPIGRHGEVLAKRRDPAVGDQDLRGVDGRRCMDGTDAQEGQEQLGAGGHRKVRGRSLG